MLTCADSCGMLKLVNTGICAGYILHMLHECLCYARIFGVPYLEAIQDVHSYPTFVTLLKSDGPITSTGLR